MTIDMKNFDRNIEEYAKLVVEVGVNIRKGQTLVVSAPISAVEFVRKIAKKAYAAGAKHVYTDWHDEGLTLIKFMNAPDEAFKEYPIWKAKGFEEMASSGAAFVTIHAENPDLLKDVDPKRIAAAQKAGATALKPFNRYRQSAEVSWCIISVPNKDWAKKMCADLGEEESIEKLWENIFKVTRVDTKDPVQTWKTHIDELTDKMDFLNTKRFIKLHYTAPGTDLYVELPKDHVWLGGGMTDSTGTYFVPNIPTEEIFTAPLKTGVNGVLKSTKPLSYAGQLIENFSFEFKDGRIVDFSAEKGYEILKSIIETDDGSHYLGEIALVPFHSPISNTNLIFYNTLFDENASSHFAVGFAYPGCVKDGSKMNNEELEKAGLNTSLTHIDFMVGSSDMNIDGQTQDGETIAVFRNGDWAI